MAGRFEIGYKNVKMLLKQMALVAIGGGAGSVLRFLAQKWISLGPLPKFPIGTMTVNVLGCLLIGLLFGWFSKNPVTAPDWKLFLMTGLCGGFTTFSAFTLESMVLLESSRWTSFLLYVCGSVILGTLATGAGYWFTK